MASYTLISSYSTVQVLSPTVVNDVVYCTLQTIPHGVIASVPVDQTEFDVNGTGPILESTAEAIETVMTDSRVVSGSPNQTVDDSGLLQDNIVFVVQYVPTGSSGTNITANAVVPIALLNFSEEPRDQLHSAQVQSIIDGVYANLQNAAGG